MAYLILIRVLSFLSVGALRSTPSLTDSIFFASIFAHYVLHIYYSPRGNSEFVRSPRRAFLIPVIILLFYISEFTWLLPITTFFGIHFLLTEVYTGPFALLSRIPKMFHFLLNLGICCIFMGKLHPFEYIPKLLPHLLIGVSCIGLLISVMMKPSHLAMWAILLYDLIGGLFSLTPIAETSLRGIVFYHVVWWILYPLRSMQPKMRAIFIAQNLVLTGVFFLLTPYVGWTPWSSEQWLYYGFLFGNAHIAISLIISSSNPNWINRLLSGVHIQRRPAL